MKLYNHQKQALDDTKNYDNVLYALDMGLGKTFVGSEKLRIYNNNHSLVVCQKSKVEDWYNHFTEYYKQYCLFDLTKKSNIEKFINTNNSIGIINYDILYRREELLKLKYITLLLDESSLIQNETTKRAKFILKMHKLGIIKNCILLSGTVVNGKYEKLWSQLYLLGWTIKKTQFLQKYTIRKLCSIRDKHFWKILGYKNVEELKDRLRQFGGVFVKTEQVFDLPKQVMNLVKCANTKLYSTFKEVKSVCVGDKVLQANKVLSERLIYRALAGVYNKNKIQAFIDLVISTEDRLIIFYCFTRELEEMVSHVKDRPISIINGSKKDLFAYNNYDNSLTFVQYQAGAMGLNLQLANKMIYFTLPDGNSELFDQSLKRIHRLNQDRPCFYYVLHTINSVEDEIVRNLNIKRKRTNFLWK